ncbi:glycoside hydrolase family 76 protein [Actinocatenispora comari]|uniref:Glycosyl hydrolase n=1 Tax=Actinocatenispora comari TaxID=2807577 RepID=A0A8J4EIE5_9ACTN|nr:glycoside hydrolase family 76 protein [Actinocatenispora comari]GIL25161.1 hypothetical protein NUM_04160 [Actinocatenispora comari]
MPRIRTLVIAAVAALCAVAVLPATAAAQPRHHHDRTADAGTAADVLMADYDPATGWWPSSWWNSAVALTTIEDYELRTGDTRYRWVIGNTYQLNKGVFAAGERSSDPVEGDFVSRAIDDTEWWGLAWLRAYDVTGDATYLNEAVTIADYVDGYWDTSTCGGGVWWDRERTYKNAVTNGLYIRLTAELHDRIPGDTRWLGKATTAWNWFLGSGLINSSNLVNDGLTNDCTNNGQTVWSYNQGLAIGAGVEMWRATGDASALATARRLAEAGTSDPALVSAGVLTESCDALTASCDDNQKQFKGVFLRYLTDLADVTGAPAYRAFATRQADTIWTRDRTADDRLGERWAGGTSAEHPNVFDWRTQASALSALLAPIPAG